MIVALALAQAAAAPAPVPANVQLQCTLATPAGPPIAAAIDLQTKKPGSAALVAGDDTLLGHVGATSDAMAWPAGGRGAVAFSINTGQANYRVELTFAGDPAAGAARARVLAIGASDSQPRVAQGFCGLRPGKRLAPKGLTRIAFDDSVAKAAPSSRLLPPPAGLDAGSCRLVTPDRAMHTADFVLTTAVKNEASVSYRFGDAGLVGRTAASGPGVRFHLVSPTTRVLTMTVQLDGTPPVYVGTDFERSGVWIALIRDRTIIAQGECGPAPLAILAPLQGQ